MILIKLTVSSDKRAIASNQNLYQTGERRMTIVMSGHGNLEYKENYLMNI
ncbi:hypothetical protein N9581_01655 [Amylibacter sp.]|nr:hypothetical protein [Amylibacter sp.]